MRYGRHLFVSELDTASSKVHLLDPEDLYKWLCQVRSGQVTSGQGQSSKLFKNVQLKLNKCQVLLWGSEWSTPGLVHNPLIGSLIGQQLIQVLLPS